MKSELAHRPLDLMILSILRTGPSHGYAIIAELSQRSAGGFNMEAGTIYPALHRLEQAHLVSGVWDAPAGRKRRLYSLTAEGQVALAARESEWRRFGACVDNVLGWADQPMRRFR